MIKATEQSTLIVRQLIAKTIENLDYVAPELRAEWLNTRLAGIMGRAYMLGVEDEREGKVRDE